MIKKIFSFVMIACIVTVVFGVICVVVQQDLRQSANDPQIQMAEDTATYLNQGGDMTQIPDEYDEVDFSQSLEAFLIIYDGQGNPLLSTGTLSGDVPALPQGVLAYAAKYGEDRITWQPASIAREAIVVVPYNDQGQSGFVLAGRSLREVEKRELSVEEIVFIGWALSMVFLAFLFVLPMITQHVFKK